ncbi:MAG: nucleotidyl transferase AbiEii/AbiGii toxin family protein [Candidatus Atribacteria bacterium]|nr:nucleotidyl transferase AbiEii/AbiGii toxin family protein [Candidatus Atribacteria bacterium]
MLSLEQIVSFYPEQLRIYKRNLLREYLQYVILEVVYRSEYGKYLIFMGGTAIHIIHGNQRFSEDLDFDNRGLKEEDFVGLSREITGKLKLMGYPVEVTNKLGNTFRSFIKFPGIFYRYGLSGHSREKLIIQLDSEPQNVDYPTQNVLINNFDILLKVKATPPEVLLAQKILAILMRPRPMGRDFYDFIFLLSKTKPSYDFLKEKMKLQNDNNLPEIKEALLRKYYGLNPKKLIEEVRPFLFHPEDAERILLFPEFIQQKMP